MDVIYENTADNIIIYSSDKKYIFTTIYDNMEISKYISKELTTPEQLIANRYSIERELIREWQ